MEISEPSGSPASRAQSVTADVSSLRTFLSSDRDRPNQAGGFVALLDYVYTDRSKDPEDERYTLIFHEIERCDTQAWEQLDEAWSEREQRQALEAHSILFYDVFCKSMQDWHHQHKKLDTSPVTRLIWRKAKDQLLKEGAIHACAEFGQDALLLEVMEYLNQRPISAEEKMRILFRTGPRSEHTALGIAIRCRQVDCVRTLTSGHVVRDVNNYVVRNNHVVTDDENGLPILHWTLRLVRAAAGQGKHIGGPAAVREMLQSHLPMLQAVIDIDPRLLYQLDLSGNPPYRVAQDLRSAVQKGHDEKFAFYDLERLIKKEIYELKDPDCVRKSLYKNKERGKEIGLVLSDFSYDSHSFEVFVDELKKFEENPHSKNWEFEETLLYLDLPSLSTRRDENSVGVVSRNDEDLVNRLLEWLARKGVTGIMKVKLPDSDGRYTAQFIVEGLLRKFHIDELDWLVTNIKPEEMEKLSSYEEPSSLKKLSLYSHGKPENIDALVKVINMIKKSSVFKRVSEINISLVDPSGLKGRTAKMGRDRTTYKTNIVNMIDAFRDGSGKECSEQEEHPTRSRMLEEDFEKEVLFDEAAPALTWDEFSAKPRAHDSGPEEETRGIKLTQDLRFCHDFLADLGQLNPTDLKNLCLKHCLEIFEHNKVKVAIIDNGADQMRGTIAANIEYGMSFTKDGLAGTPYLPWYTAADPHGTQMAYLVRNVNPYCRLYPLRAGSLREDIDPDAAAEAILWAIDHDIDIISMSWIVKEKNTALERAVRKAKDKCLVFCSTADIGAQANADIWPADFPGVIAVSASNAHGLPRPESQHDVHVMLHGDQVVAHGPKYMREHMNTKISGSSVATALAAGVGSLCLFLARMANVNNQGRPNGKAEKFKERLAMLWLLRQMQVGGQDRVIVPSRLFSSQGFPSPGSIYGGQGGPPEGLARFSYEGYEQHLKDEKRPERVDLLAYIPRRAKSLESLRQQSGVDARR